VEKASRRCPEAWPNSKQETIMQNTYQTQQELVASVASCIDHSSLHQCYWRNDPAIEAVGIVPPSFDLAQVAAWGSDGAPETLPPDLLVSVGALLLIPAVGRLERDCSDPQGPWYAKAIKWRRYLEARRGDEVLAFYAPPLYWLQFTGRRQHQKPKNILTPITSSPHQTKT
jgi:hypothetical protein